MKLIEYCTEDKYYLVYYNSHTHKDCTDVALCTYNKVTNHLVYLTLHRLDDKIYHKLKILFNPKRFYYPRNYHIDLIFELTDDEVLNHITMEFI